MTTPGLPRHLRVPGVPELRKADDQDPIGLREVLATQVREAMRRKAMGGPAHSFEISGALIPNAQTRSYEGGWILIIARKTGLLGEASVIIQPVTIPVGYPTREQIELTIDQARQGLDALHASLLAEQNGRSAPS